MSDFDDDKYLKKLDEFRKKLKKKDEVLYYDFLNFYDDWLMRLKKDSDEYNKNTEKATKLSTELELKIIKNEMSIHDSHINLEQSSAKINKELDELKTKLTSKEYDKELIGRFIEDGNALSLAVMGSPRRCGFMLLIGGTKGIDILEKFINKNRNELKKHIVNKAQQSIEDVMGKE